MQKNNRQHRYKPPSDQAQTADLMSKQQAASPSMHDVRVELRYQTAAPATKQYLPSDTSPNDVLRMKKVNIWFFIMVILLSLVACEAPSKLNLIVNKAGCDAYYAKYDCSYTFSVPTNPRLFGPLHTDFYEKDFTALPDSVFLKYIAKTASFDKIVNNGRFHVIKTRYLPAQFLRAKNLKSVYIRAADGIDWDRLSSQLKDSCKNLEYLYFSHVQCDKLSYIPTKAFVFAQLRELTFTPNYVFEDFPFEIKQMKNLEKLFLLSKTADKVVFQKVIKYLPKLNLLSLRDGDYIKRGEKWEKSSSHTYTRDTLHDCIILGK